MKTNQEIQNELKVLFRAQELGHRQQRRDAIVRDLNILKARMRNEGILINELLTPEDQKFHETAIAMMKAQEEHMQKELSPGYWWRLKNALLNK